MNEDVPIKRKVAIVTNNTHCERHIQYYSTLEKYFIMNGWTVTEDFSTEKVIICACGFHDAMFDKMMTVLNQLKKIRFLEKNIILVGCLPRTHEQDLSIHFRGHVVEIGREALLDELIHAVIPFHRVQPVNIFRAHKDCQVTPGDKIFAIKISQGCLCQCTFCVINKAKGKIKSVPFTEIKAQFEHAVEQGHRRIFLMGEDTFAYGIDMGTDIIRLIKSLAFLAPGMEIYFGYLHNRWLKEYAEDILSLCRQGVIRELHLGLQHIDDEMLNRMGRPVVFAEIYDIIRTIKKENPGFYLGCDVMVGFPGETEEKFSRLVTFFQEDRCFNKVRHFGYCDVKGAPANKLPDKLPSPVILQRWEYLDKILEKRSSYIPLDEISRIDDATFKWTQIKDYTFCIDTCLEEIKPAPNIRNLSNADQAIIKEDKGDFVF